MSDVQDNWTLCEPCGVTTRKLRTAVLDPVKLTTDINHHKSTPRQVDAQI